MSDTALLSSSGPGGGHRLHVGEPERVPVTVVRSPQHSVAVLTLAAAPRRMRLPTRALEDHAPQALVAALRPHSTFALEPILRSDLRTLPDLLIPIERATDVTMPEQLGHLRSDTAADELVADLTVQFGHTPPEEWKPVLEHPRAWVDSMAAASADTWAVFEPVWRQRQWLIDREIQRLGIARIRGGTSTLLDNLHPDLHFVDGCLVKTNTGRTASYELGDRQIVLVPALADPKTVLLSFERPQTVTITYAVPGSGGEPGRLLGDPLADMLGEPRAALLRAVPRPIVIGTLARRLYMAPSTATYHCARLERAGLVVRERTGQTVHVSITERGRQLIDTLSATPA